MYSGYKQQVEYVSSCVKKNIKGANGITWTTPTCFWGNILI
jgi:hypothetical protein